LILPNQGGFVVGGKIWEKFILVEEAIHSNFRRGEVGMVIKLDTTNAFDRVNHYFLKIVLQKFRFDQAFISWVNSCISNPWITPLINGRLAPFLKSSRGSRQGFPLPPYYMYSWLNLLTKAWNGNS
jgi:hypothetical protein